MRALIPHVSAELPGSGRDDGGTGVIVSFTIPRWVQRYVPEFEKRWSRYARSVHSSWRMDETSVPVRGGAHYLYRAVDKHGKTVESFLGTDRSDLIRCRRYLNNVIEQDHRAIKRRCAPMLALKSFPSADVAHAEIPLCNNSWLCAGRKVESGTRAGRPLERTSTPNVPELCRPHADRTGG
jgi:transposase-like protein